MHAQLCDLRRLSLKEHTKDDPKEGSQLELRELLEKTEGREALNAELERLHAKQSELMELLKQKKQNLEYEQSDVTELESNTLKSFFYSAIGKREERLMKEEDEAAEAKQQYEAVLAEAERVDVEIRRIENRLKELKYAESRYKKAIKDLYARVARVEPMLSDADAMTLGVIRRELERMEQHQAYYGRIRDAGQELLGSLEALDEALGEMLYEGQYGAGITAEYERLHEAKARGRVAVTQTKRFQELLAEGVTLSEEYCIDPAYVDALIKRLTYRAFGDHPYNPSIGELLLPDVPSVALNVRGILNDLEKKSERIKRHRAELERRLSELVDKYPVTE